MPTRQRDKSKLVQRLRKYDCFQKKPWWVWSTSRSPEKKGYITKPHLILYILKALNHAYGYIHIPNRHNDSSRLGPHGHVQNDDDVLPEAGKSSHTTNFHPARTSAGPQFSPLPGLNTRSLLVSGPPVFWSSHHSNNLPSWRVYSGQLAPKLPNPPPPPFDHHP